MLRPAAKRGRARASVVPLWASRASFYGYTGFLVGAGATGMLFAKTDVELISGFRPLDELGPGKGANVMSQHRFLRAIELGCGLLMLANRERIETERGLNRLYLGIVAGGVAARAIGLAADGRPRPSAYAFAGAELVSGGLFYAHTRATIGPRR